MKTKRTAIWILACVMVLFTAFTIGCKSKNDKTAKTVKEITLSDATAEIKAGGAIVYADYTVTANYTDGSNKVVPLTEKMFKAEDLAKFENAGTYEIEVSAFGKTTLLTVTVTNYTFEGVTAADVNVVYDGTAKVPTLNNAPAGATAVWTYYAGTDKTGAVVSEAVNAGTYYAEGVVSLKYYNDATVSANVVIAKKAVNPAELQWENLKRVYTGSAIDANVTASDLPEGVTVSYEGDGKTGTAVGKYTVTLKFDDSLSQNYEMTAETYDVEWEIIAPLEATWFGAENGALCVADFKSDSETSGTLTFNGQTTTYTVAFDDKGNATFSGLNGNVTAISLKGGILRLTAGEKNYLLVNKDDLNTYFAGSEYDMLLAQFRIDLNETDKTLKLVVTTEANGEQEYPLTISAGDSETLAKNVKLSASETLYLDYYYSYGVRINGFENPNGYKSESNYVLATKSAVAAALKNLVNGEFKDLDGNTLVVNGYEDIKYNGRAVKLYAVNYYGKATLYAAINSGKTNAELAPNAGYVKFNNSSFYDKNLIVKAGTYYFEKDGVISDAETFGYLTSSNNYTVTAKILKGETAESKTFTVNGAETADRALLDLGKDGRLTVTLYLKNETEVYATFVVNANGTAVTYGEKTFKKVEKLIEKATGYSSSKYYGADGTVLSYDGKGAFTFADASFGKTVTFAYNGVDYKGNLVELSPSVRIVTVPEYEFFFGSTYYESDNAYGVTVNGKTLKFDYEIKSLSQNYSDYQFAFKSLSFDGKAATANAIYYSTAAKTVVFTTADGTYAYNLTTKALTDNVTFEGVAALINNKNTSDGSVYVTARITSVEGKVAKVGLFYDFGNKGGLKAVTATAVDGGYKLSGEGLATTYLLEEGDAYALYTEEQYLLAGTYAIGGKDLVITGTHANGKFTYTAAYGGAEAVAVTPDFTAKSFMIKDATSATMFGWTNENGVLNFTATELPAAALDFLIDGDYMINLDYTYYNYEMRISLKGVDNGKVKFNVNYSTGWGSGTTVEGTLSDDGTYISAYISYDIRIYVNAVYDYYYKLVAVKESSAAAKYLGTFTVNETEKVSIALGATSEEDEDEEELAGLASSCIKVTYKGKTVKASTKYSASVSEIEFTVDGKTYVAKLVDGAMTVTEKAAA